MANNKDFKVKNGIKPTVYHEGVGTVTSGSVVNGYDLSVAAFDSVTASISQVGDERGLRFSTDGTKFYVLDGNTPQSVYQYNLSTAWDLSTSSYSNNSFSVSSQETQPTGIAFKSDGTKMYVIGYTGDDVNEYNLSTAWDVSTASYSQVFSVASQTTLPTDIYFKPDGTAFYVAGSSNVYQYSLSTAWDISTSSYSSNSVSVSETDGLAFKADGTAFYVVGNTSDTVYEYTLTTAWDVSTASASGQSFSVNAQDTIPYGIDFKSDGTKMYIMGLIGTDVNQYTTGSTTTTATLDLSTGSVFEITPTSDIQIGLSNPAASGTVSAATLLLDGAAISSYDITNAAYDSVTYNVSALHGLLMSFRFNNDGTKLYTTGSSADAIYEHNLSIAYDITSATYNSVSLSVASQETNIRDFKFKSDGTEIYIVGTTSDRVKQYTLSTAWDLSTASYTTQSPSVGTQTPEPYCFILNNDGTKLYVGDGSANDAIYSYTLSTAYNISTASYDSSSVSTSAQVAAMRDMIYNSDGTKLYLLDGTSQSIYQYSLSTAYNPLTLSYDSVSFSFTSQEVAPTGIEFNGTGTKLFLVGSDTDTVHQYSTGAAATITYSSTLQWAGGTAPTSPALGETDVLTFTTRDGGTTYQAAIAIDGAA